MRLIWQRELQQLSAHFHSRSGHLVSLVYSDGTMSRDPVEGVAGISTSTMEMHVAPSMLFSCCMTANEDVTVANITCYITSVDPARLELASVRAAADKQMCSPLFQLRHRSRVGAF